jgi:hypothetical protein
MQLFSILDKAMPDTENIGRLNLEPVKLRTVRVIKLQLYRELHKIGIICSSMPGLRAVLYITPAHTLTYSHGVGHDYAQGHKS